MSFKKVFPGSIAFLNRKFFNMLAALQNAKYLKSISESVVNLGERHILKYGAQLEHFTTLRQALIKAVEIYLAERFTPELQAAWHEVFDDVAKVVNKAMSRVDRRESRRTFSDDSTFDLNLLEDMGGEERSDPGTPAFL